jgi:hypothetical protein
MQPNHLTVRCRSRTSPNSTNSAHFNTGYCSMKLEYKIWLPSDSIFTK